MAAGRLEALPIVCDVTDQDQVDALAAAVGPRCDVVLNNAGGALGQDPIETADVADWERMYQINVAGSLRVTQALLDRGVKGLVPKPYGLEELAGALHDALNS